MKKKWVDDSREWWRRRGVMVDDAAIIVCSGWLCFFVVYCTCEIFSGRQARANHVARSDFEHFSKTSIIILDITNIAVGCGMEVETTFHRSPNRRVLYKLQQLQCVRVASGLHSTPRSTGTKEKTCHCFNGTIVHPPGE